MGAYEGPELAEVSLEKRQLSLGSKPLDRARTWGGNGGECHRLGVTRKARVGLANTHLQSQAGMPRRCWQYRFLYQPSDF